MMKEHKWINIHTCDTNNNPYNKSDRAGFCGYV